MQKHRQEVQKMEYRLAAFHLLELLQTETDPAHRLTQQQISERMQSRYGVKLSRKTLKGNLDLLREAGFPLSAESSEYVSPDGSSAVRETAWYMEPQLELSELRLLFDLLQSIPALPEKQRSALFEKLCADSPYSAPEFADAAEQTVVHLHRPPAKQLLYTVDILCEAIRTDRMVSFTYSKYELMPDGKPALVPRTKEDGSPRIYSVSPYRILVSHGRYYLVCRKAPHSTLSHYRVDRITDIRLLDFPREPFPESGAFRPEPVEQLYMYSGERVTARFLADRAVLGDVIDWFGDSARIVPSEQGQLLVTVQVHPQAMKHWALQYAGYVTVLEPANLREALSEAAKQLAEKYP